jgi:hypothetical protein
MKHVSRESTMVSRLDLLAKPEYTLRAEIKVPYPSNGRSFGALKLVLSLQNEQDRNEQ